MPLWGRALPIQARAAIAFQNCPKQLEREITKDHGFRMAEEAGHGMRLSSRLLHPNVLHWGDGHARANVREDRQNESDSFLGEIATAQ